MLVSSELEKAAAFFKSFEAFSDQSDHQTDYFRFIYISVSIKTLKITDYSVTTFYGYHWNLVADRAGNLLLMKARGSLQPVNILAV